MNHNYSLLVTKLYAPRVRATAISRQRLLRRLSRVQAGQCILVSAPAGAGKTTLIAEWTQPQREQSCWLALDEGDNDPARFLTYLIAAIQTRAPEVGRELISTLQEAHPPPLEELVEHLINELAALAERLIIVLDDYHAIADEQIHRAMTHLLAHAPSQTTFALLTRSDPPLPLARMRANGDMVEVRAVGLAFTLSEATDFFNDALGLNLADEEIGALNERTEGWSAGLHLAGLALQQQGRDKEAFIHSFAGSHHHVLDYLVEEVLASQPDEVRDFLVRTSPLREFNAALCDAVTQSDNGQAMLDYLERHNLFLVPLDDARQWYRYHQLFADLLRGELGSREPEAAQQVHRLAARWNEAQGYHEQATEHALMAGDYDYAAGIMQSYLAIAYWQTQLSTLRRWYRLWPPDFINKSPVLAFIFGHMLAVRGFPTEAAHLLGEIDVEKLPLHNRLTIDFLNVKDAHDAESFATLAAQAQPTHPVDYLMLASVLSCSGNYVAACETIDQSQAFSERSGDGFSRWACLIHRCRLHALAGNLRQAYELCQLAVQDAEGASGPVTEMIGLVYVALARVLLCWNRLDDAARYARLAIRVAEQTHFVMAVLPAATMLLAEIRQAQGDGEGALDEAMDALAHSRRLELASEGEWLRAYAVQIQLQQGDLPAAADWLAQRRTLPPSRFYPQSICRLVEAQIHLAQNRPSRAINLLTALTAATPDLHAAEAWLLLALARQQQGNGQHALIALTTALSLAEPENNSRAILAHASLHGPALVKLLRRFRREQPTNQFVQQLLDELPATPQAPAQQAVLLEPLNEREQQVLALIIAGHSNKEIAAQLMLAVSTIKWYVNELYGKLHVRSRSQAIARAHELGLATQVRELA